ncbi:kinase-like domain-containing protein [Elsinoe ampelina]|uniref:non-specific serine/threonine protein kinase n=1 Tax=Elsinoe ampelina TaxID=302913 RepID=A0A6A6G9A6_9PEZI|nr:kinase-like domain-containing protein [Elsinoe ampelina]
MQASRHAFRSLLFRRRSLNPCVWIKACCTVPDRPITEEDEFDHFRKNQYYPVEIGQLMNERYRVLGKLGFGSTSTVWLAQDLVDRDRVTIKVYTRDGANKDEMKILERLRDTDPDHAGYIHVRHAQNVFTIHRGPVSHQCLVLKPMWESYRELLFRNASRRFTPALLKAGLTHVFRALDYLHGSCNIIHTDIKADNILQSIEDKSVLENFVKAELAQPSPRKLVDGKLVFVSRRLDLPKEFGIAVLSDFGSAVDGKHLQDYDAQPDVYRSPEVMLRIPWSYPIDIWNVGVMVWDLFEGRHMFYGHDPHINNYSTRAHLAEVIGLLGPPPLDLLQRGKRSSEFFDENGSWKAIVDIPKNVSLEQFESFMDGEKKLAFLKFTRRMLQWRPEDRATAKELLEDPWLNSPSDPEDFYNT